MTASKHGQFHWNELMTWKPEDAKTFYAETLDWQYEVFPMAEGDYIVCKAGDDAVGGIFPMTQGAGFDGMPDHWFAYIAVDDVDARVSKVAAAGGEVIRPPFDVPDVGRIALVRDKAGGAVGWITPAQPA